MTHATSEARDASLASLLFTLALLLDPQKRDSIGSLTAGRLTRAHAGLLGGFSAPEPHEALAYHFGATGYQNVTGVAVHPSGGFAASLLRPDGTSTIVSGLSLNPARGSGIARNVYETAGLVSGLHFPKGSRTPAWQSRPDRANNRLTFTVHWGSWTIENCWGGPSSDPVFHMERGLGERIITTVIRQGKRSKKPVLVAYHTGAGDWRRTDEPTHVFPKDTKTVSRFPGDPRIFEVYLPFVMMFVYGDEAVTLQSGLASPTRYPRVANGRLEVLTSSIGWEPTGLHAQYPCVSILRPDGGGETIEDAILLNGRIYRLDGAHILAEDGTHLFTLPVGVIPRRVTRVPGGHIIRLPKTQAEYTRETILGFAPDGNDFVPWDLPSGLDHGTLGMLGLVADDDVVVLYDADHFANRLLVAHSANWGSPASALELVAAPHVKSPVLIREGDHTVAYTLRKDDASVRVLRYPLT